MEGFKKVEESNRKAVFRTDGQSDWLSWRNSATGSAQVSQSKLDLVYKQTKHIPAFPKLGSSRNPNDKSNYSVGWHTNVLAPESEDSDPRSSSKGKYLAKDHLEHELAEEQQLISQQEHSLSCKKRKLDATDVINSTPTEYIPSIIYSGLKSGYIFKLGKRGLGYYLDNKYSLQENVNTDHVDKAFDSKTTDVEREREFQAQKDRLNLIKLEQQSVSTANKALEAYYLNQNVQYNKSSNKSNSSNKDDWEVSKDPLSRRNVWTNKSSGERSFTRPFVESTQASDIVNITNTAALCEEIYKLAKFVRFNDKKLDEFVDEIDPKDLIPETKDSAVNKANSYDLLQKFDVYFAYNAINYSFFPEKNSKRWFIEEEGRIIGDDDEAHAIVASLISFQRSNPKKLSDPEFLKNLELESLIRMFKPAGDGGMLPLLETRLTSLRKLGKGYELLRRGNENKHPLDILKDQCKTNNQYSVLKFIDLMCKYFPEFEDISVYGNIKVPFMKRAQLLIAMLHSDEIIIFDDIDQLTVFADYRIPQLFRHKLILNYRNNLERIVDSQEYIASGSKMEVEIRASTIHISEIIKKRLKSRRNIEVESRHLDYFLWRTAVDLAEKKESNLMKPFHRTRSIYY